MKVKHVAIDASHLNELLRSYIRSKQYSAAWEVFGVMMSNTSNSNTRTDRTIVKMSEKLSSASASAGLYNNNNNNNNLYNGNNDNIQSSKSNSSSSIGISSLITDSYNIVKEKNIRDKIFHANREDNIFNSYLKHSRQHEQTYRLGMDLARN